MMSNFAIYAMSTSISSKDGEHLPRFHDCNFMMNEIANDTRLSLGEPRRCCKISLKSAKSSSAPLCDDKICCLRRKMEFGCAMKRFGGRGNRSTSCNEKPRKIITKLSPIAKSSRLQSISKQVRVIGGEPNIKKEVAETTTTARPFRFRTEERSFLKAANARQSRSLKNKVLAVNKQDKVAMIEPDNCRVEKKGIECEEVKKAYGAAKEGTDAKGEMAAANKVSSVLIDKTDSMLQKPEKGTADAEISLIFRNEMLSLSAIAPLAADDSADPQMCEAYASDIYEYVHLLEKEDRRRPLPDYIGSVQTDITTDMRAMLVAWLVWLSEEYKLFSDTLFLSVSYIDRILSLHPLVPQQLELLGVTCMLVASKYEEVSPLHVEDFCNITDNVYTIEEVLEMEESILTMLKFELGDATINTFIRRVLRFAPAGQKPPTLQLEYICNFLSELCLIDYTCVKYLPSLIAASVVFLAKLSLNPDDHPWNLPMQIYSGYKPSDLKACVLAIHDLQHNKKWEPLEAAEIKYKQHRYKFSSTLLSPVVIPSEYFEDPNVNFMLQKHKKETADSCELADGELKLMALSSSETNQNTCCQVAPPCSGALACLPCLMEFGCAMKRFGGRGNRSTSCNEKPQKIITKLSPIVKSSRLQAQSISKQVRVIGGEPNRKKEVTKTTTTARPFRFRTEERSLLKAAKAGQSGPLQVKVLPVNKQDKTKDRKLCPRVAKEKGFLKAAKAGLSRSVKNKVLAVNKQDKVAMIEPDNCGVEREEIECEEVKKAYGTAKEGTDAKAEMAAANKVFSVLIDKVNFMLQKPKKENADSCELADGELKLMALSSAETNQNTCCQVAPPCSGALAYLPCPSLLIGDAIEPEDRRQLRNLTLQKPTEMKKSIAEIKALRNAPSKLKPKSTRPANLGTFFSFSST